MAPSAESNGALESFRIPERGRASRRSVQFARMPSFRICAGLPSSGPLAISFPTEWGRLGREGLVVEFTDSSGKVWTGNFKPGLGGLQDVLEYPDRKRVIVVSRGDAWSVDIETREASEILNGGILEIWRVANGLVANRQGLHFIRLGPNGVIWRTRRLSWDGFEDVRVTDFEITGRACFGSWVPFRVDIETGRVEGGCGPMPGEL